VVNEKIKHRGQDVETPLQAADVLPDGNSRLLDTSWPFARRVEALARTWEESGRDGRWLANGKAFFALQCWFLAAERHHEALDGTAADYVRHAFDAIGGTRGWDAMLAEKARCSCHFDSWRLENISVCLGCLRYLCYQHPRRCGPDCDGEIVG
jgi:hypothetical protein